MQREAGRSASGNNYEWRDEKAERALRQSHLRVLHSQQQAVSMRLEADRGEEWAAFPDALSDLIESQFCLYHNHHVPMVHAQGLARIHQIADALEREGYGLVNLESPEQRAIVAAVLRPLYARFAENLLARENPRCTDAFNYSEWLLLQCTSTSWPTASRWRRSRAASRAIAWWRRRSSMGARRPGSALCGDLSAYSATERGFRHNCPHTLLVPRSGIRRVVPLPPFLPAASSSSGSAARDATAEYSKA